MFDSALRIDEKTQVALERKKSRKSAVIDMLRTAQ
jgi:hypothetical protein